MLKVHWHPSSYIGIIKISYSYLYYIKLIKEGLQVIKVGGLITITTGTNKRKSACVVRIKILFKMIPKKVCKFVLDSR